jgi:hypothetical protein
MQKRPGRECQVLDLGIWMLIRYYRLMLMPGRNISSVSLGYGVWKWADMVDLQELRFLCVETVKGLVKSTVQLPYTVKMLARETLLALRVCPSDRITGYS